MGTCFLRSNRLSAFGRCGVSLAIICATVLLAVTAPILGQTADPVEEPGATSPATPPATAKTHPHDPMVWNVEQMMEDAVLQIARRYNLNKAQEGYTRLLLRRRVLAFLETNEDDVRLLLKESIDFKMGTKKATPEAFISWAIRAKPLYDAAANAILEGNAEWREVLSDEQRILHDQDLGQMERNFEQIANVLDGMQAGNTPPFVLPQKSSQAREAGGVGQVSRNPPVIAKQLMEANWLAYVEQFIRTYRLDEKQRNSAKAGIHKEMFGKAQSYREKHKVELREIEAGLQPPAEGSKAARGDKGAKGAKSRHEVLRRRRSKLEQPIRQMFVDMHRRLHGLLRAEQRKKADPEQKKILDKMYRDLSSVSRDKQRGIKGVKRRPDPRRTTQGGAAATTKPAKPKDAGRDPARPTSKPSKAGSQSPNQPAGTKPKPKPAAAAGGASPKPPPKATPKG